MSNIKHARYVGDNPLVPQGSTALVMTHPSKGPDHVLVQVDDINHAMAHGWWDFPASAWAIVLEYSEVGFDPSLPAER